MVKIDLHMHGPIGFQSYWLKKQGYAGKNLLEMIVDQCILKGIDVSAVTSQTEKLLPGTAQDRFYCLREVEAPRISGEYVVESIGDNLIRVEKGEKFVYLVNGQTAIANEGGQDLDVLLVGKNNIPSSLSVSDTLLRASDNGLVKIAEHPFLVGHRGMGKNILDENLESFDAIEGYNSQAILPAFLGKIPVLDRLEEIAGRKMNVLAIEYAESHGMPYVATSDAHRIKDLGLSHIETVDDLDFDSEEEFLSSLGRSIREGRFSNNIGNISFFGFMDWTSKFVRSPKNNSEVYLPCELI